MHKWNTTCEHQLMTVTRSIQEVAQPIGEISAMPLIITLMIITWMSPDTYTDAINDEQKLAAS